MTSHHPVLMGADWRFPADIGETHQAPPLAAVLGPMYNFELEGATPVTGAINGCAAMVRVGMIE